MYPFTKAQKCFERHFSSSSSSLNVINASNVFHCFQCTYITTNQTYCICKTHEKKCNVSFIYFLNFQFSAHLSYAHLRYVALGSMKKCRYAIDHFFSKIFSLFFCNT